jgi:ABC-type sulfate/molybdate transport systems ATPase subunit
MVVLHNGKVIHSGTPIEVLERPGSVEVASLLNRYCLIPAEILRLDPAAHTSMLMAAGAELDGPHLPGRLRGDHVTLYADPRRIKALPSLGRAPRNHIPCTLERAIDTPDGVRLQFHNRLFAEMPRAEFQPNSLVREWWVEVPASAIRVI